MDVYFFEAFAEEAEMLHSFLDSTGEWAEAGYTRETVQESGLSQEEPPAPIISIRTQSRIPIAWADKLQAVLTRSTGYDHITELRAEASQRGHLFEAGNLPLYCNRAVAEQAALLWMALLRKLKLQQQQFSTFDRDGLTGFETEGRHLSVFGVGNIGYEVVRIGHGLGMRVMGVDPERKWADVTYRGPDEALRDADIVVVAMDLNPGNGGMFFYEFLKQSKPGAIFINVARGELSPCETLLQLLEEGHLGGVGLDVFDEESNLGQALRGFPHEKTAELEAALKLMKRDDVILTPHNAFNTVEAVERKARQTVEQLEHFRVHRRFLYALD